MGALNASNGIITIANTTDTFTQQSQGSSLGPQTGGLLTPQAMILTASAASHAILVDADGVVLADLFAPVSGNALLDGHFFAGIRPYKTPIKCSTLTGGGKLRIYI
jgi:hypothetical protein